MVSGHSSTSDKHSHHLAYCLAQLSYNEKSFTKLADAFKCYATKLCDEEVLEHFMVILAKAKKISKPEVSKEVLGEWEVRLSNASQGKEWSSSTTTTSLPLSNVTNKRGKKGKAEQTSTRKTRARKTRKKAIVESESEDDMCFSSDNECETFDISDDEA